jgi:hypothetical protein
MDREKVKRCLEQVAAYRASGQKASVWAAANGLELAVLQSWCTHARRWQARLDGVTPEPTASPKPSGFVAARVAAAAAPTSVRIELNTPGTRLDLHWPVAHMRELALLLRELGQ